MPIYLLPSLIISLFAVGYTPGPANIYILSCVLSHGKRAAMRCWFGLFCGFSTAALFAAVAAYFAELALGVYIVYIKYLGASYMVYLAWKCYRSNISGGEGVKCSFWSGFIVQISNAKMILFNLTVYSSFVLPYSSRFIDLLPVAALLLIAGPGANMVWLLGGNLLRPYFIKYMHTVNMAISIALLLCAAMIIFL